MTIAAQCSEVYLPLEKAIRKCEKRIERLKDSEAQYAALVAADQLMWLPYLLHTREEILRLSSICSAYAEELSHS